MFFCMRCSLVNEYPPPTFGPIACVGSKFTQKSTHPRTSFAWLMEPLVEFEDYCKKLGTFKRHHSVGEHSECDTHCELHHVHGEIILIQRNHQWLRSQALMAHTL